MMFWVCSGIVLFCFMAWCAFLIWCCLAVSSQISQEEEEKWNL